jgi:gamma-glutamylcysteine synthetase
MGYAWGVLMSKLLIRMNLDPTPWVRCTAVVALLGALLMAPQQASAAEEKLNLTMTRIF